MSRCDAPHPRESSETGRFRSHLPRVASHGVQSRLGACWENKHSRENNSVGALSEELVVAGGYLLQGHGRQGFENWFIVQPPGVAGFVGVLVGSCHQPQSVESYVRVRPEPGSPARWTAR